MNQDNVYLIGEFSKKTGISIRTLHYYDDIGLLTPQKAPHSGHRIYDQHDILTIQKIVSFKFLGYSLDEIIKLLKVTSFGSALHDTLQLQKQAFEEKQAHIKAALKVIDRVITTIAEEKEVDSDILLSLIQSIQTENEQRQWLEQFVSEEAITKLYNRDEQEMESLDKRFIQFSKEVKRLTGTPVEHAEVQRLIDEHMKLNLAFVGEENVADFNGILEAEEEILDKMAQMPPSPFTVEEDEWLQQAMAYYMLHSS